MYSHKKETPPPNQAFPALPRPSENQEERKELEAPILSCEILTYVPLTYVPLPMLEEAQELIVIPRIKIPRSELDSPFRNHEFSKEKETTHEEILNMLDEHPFLLEE